MGWAPCPPDSALNFIQTMVRSSETLFPGLRCSRARKDSRRRRRIWMFRSQGTHAMLAAVLLLTVLGLAYANGANDNFKGVATLLGSGTCNYRKALTWATATTLAGSLLALVLAHGLVEAFKGKGLVPDAITQEPNFLMAVSF